MSDLYEVYQHSGGSAFGVNVNNGQVTTAHLAGRRLTIKAIPSYQLAAEIGRRVRSGYVKVNRPKYLETIESDGGALEGAFIDHHPELTAKKDYLVFTPVGHGDDCEGLAMIWESQVEKTNVRPKDVEQWIKSVRKAKAYFVAPSVHPAFALVIADWAIKQKRSLVAGFDNMPVYPPSEVPSLWIQWLGNVFSKPREIRDALDALGWSVLASTTPTLDVTHESLPTGESWFASANEVAF